MCVYVLTHTHTHKPILFQLNKTKQTARLHDSLNTVDVCEYATFRQVRKAAKSICQLRRACSSAWFPLDGFLWNFDSGTFIKVF
jgi:tRNA(Leu) C34 or U34 (ribose-2'-O)-methylase TrmL